MHNMSAPILSGLEHRMICYAVKTYVIVPKKYPENVLLVLDCNKIALPGE